MKYRRPSINLTEDQAEMLDIIMRREGYRSPTEVFQSMLRHNCLSQQPHTITGKWASLPPFERDELDRNLLAMLKAGKGEKGSWLKKVIYDAIKEIAGADAKSPTVDQVISMIPEKIRKVLDVN